MARTIFITLALVAMTQTANANPFVKSTVNALKGVSKGSVPCAQFKGAYANGNGHAGWLFLTIKDGIVTLRQTQPGQQDIKIESKLTDTECKAIAKAGASKKLWSVRPLRKWGKADETLPRITLGVQKVGSFMVTQWTHDIPKTPAFAKTQQAMQQVVKRIRSEAHQNKSPKPSRS